MLIITLRTDKPEAEIGLFKDKQRLAYETWPAHRQLAETIHQKIQDQLDENGQQLPNVQGIVFYKGPGSFTGLRIGAAVANALASELPALIVGVSGSEWINQGLWRLLQRENDQLIIPEYGAPVRTTRQKK